MSGEFAAGTVFGDYRILDVLGRGGMSVVYRAEDQRLGRQVALKVLDRQLTGDPAFRERFERESLILASIEHDNIVEVFDAGDRDGVAFIAMRLIEGQDLGSVLRSSGQLGAAAVSHICAEVGAALDSAHARGLVHRDVKPGNILIAPSVGNLEQARVYLSDFGLAKRNDAPTGLTLTGQFLGTVDYVAPEQIQGADVDGRADLYALACVVFQCLAGHPPFHEARDAAALMAHLVTRPPRLSAIRADLPKGVSAVLARAMAKNRDQRYATGAELAAALRRSLAGAPIAHPDHPPAAAHAWPRIAEPVQAEADRPSATGSGGDHTIVGLPTAAVEPIRDSARRAAPGVPARHMRRRRSRRPVAGMAIGMLALLAVGAAAAVTLGLVARNNPPPGATDSPSGSAPGSTALPPLDVTAAEQALRGYIPVDVWPLCRPDPAVAPALAVRVCMAPGGAIELRYSVYPDEARMNEAYEHVRRRLGVEDGEGQASRCADPGEWPNEGPWSFRGTPSGRLMCVVAGGRPTLQWTDRRANVLGESIGHGVTGAYLYLFWKDGRLPSADDPTSSPTSSPVASPGRPTPSPTATAVTPAEQLREHIPRDRRRDCSAATPAAFVLASWRCPVDGGLIEVTYSLYRDAESMSTAYEQVRVEHGVDRDARGERNRCLDPADWPNEGPYTFERVERGRILCTVSGGAAHIYWTDLPLKILSHAVHHGADGATLFGFWRERGGPVN